MLNCENDMEIDDDDDHYAFPFVKHPKIAKDHDDHKIYTTEIIVEIKNHEGEGQMPLLYYENLWPKEGVNL